MDETLPDNGGVPESIATTCDLVAAAFEGLDPQQLRQANTAGRNYWPKLT